MVLTPTSYKPTTAMPESNTPSTELAWAYQRIGELSQENKQLKQTLVSLQQQHKPEEQLFTLHVAYHLPSILYVYDMVENRTVYLNQAVETVLGYDLRIAQRLPWPLVNTLLHPEDMSQAIAHQEQLSNNSDNQFCETEYRVKDVEGAWHWMYVRSAVLTRTEEGQPKRIVGLMEDITDRKKIKTTLERRIVREQLLAIISTDFINTPSYELDDQLQQALLIVGHFFRVERTYIFLSTINDLYINYYEWYTDTIDPGFNPAMRPALDETFPWLNQQGQAQETVVLTDLAELPPAANQDQHILSQRNVKSLITIPLMAGGDYIGLFGLESVRCSKDWAYADVRLLQLIGQILGSGIERLHTDRKLRRTNAMLETLVSEQTRTLQQIVAHQEAELLEQKEMEQSIRGAERLHRQQVERLRLLYYASLQLNQILPIATLTKVICDHAKTLLMTNSVALYLYDETTHLLELSTGLGIWSQQNQQYLNLDEGIVGEAYQQKKAQYIENVTAALHPQLISGVVTTIKALLVLPLLKDEKVLGVLMVARNQRRKESFKFTHDDIRIAEMLTAQATLALYNNHYLYTTGLYD